MKLIVVTKTGLWKKKITAHSLEILPDGTLKPSGSTKVTKRDLDSSKYQNSMLFSTVDGIKNILKQTQSKKSGRTTRLVDFAIQKLFSEGSIDLKQIVSKEENETKLPITVYQIIAKRLRSEHAYYFKNKIHADMTDLTFSLKNKKTDGRIQ